MSNVLVTGCSSGIGHATALALGKAGHTVFATMRNPDRAAQLRATVDREKLPITILKLDVDSDQSVEAAFSAARSKAGFIDALVNNAAVFIGGSIEEGPLATPSFRTKHLKLDEQPSIEEAQQARISGKDRPEFPEPTTLHERGAGAPAGAAAATA